MTTTNPLTTLETTFGLSSFKPGQEKIIAKVLAGENAFAVFPTGGGKSLCYQLPALSLPHLTLVVSPLLSLMKDQLEFLKKVGIPAGKIDSSQSPGEQSAILSDAGSGKIKILMISVERFKNEKFRVQLQKVAISLLVIDEAHCISEWGHNFRPDYLMLPEYRNQFHIPQTLLLTATATPDVREDVAQKFQIAPESVVVTGFYRQNLNLLIRATSEVKRVESLASIIASAPDVSTIIYVTQQLTAERVAQDLNNEGLPGVAYHAGLDSDVRASIQDDFMSGKLPVIIATIAFGMGIDKADIRRVIHYDLPKSLENYSQEIGRAGRDGKTSQCIMLAGNDSVATLENFVIGDTPSESEVHTVVEQIPRDQQNWHIKTYQLSVESNIRLLPLKTLLVYLEKFNIIEPGYSYAESYSFKMLKGEHTEISSMFSGERKQFLDSLFEYASAKKTWVHIDMEGFLKERDTRDRARAVRALQFLESKEILSLKLSKQVAVYRVLDNTFDSTKLTSKVHQLFLQRESREIERLDKTISFFKDTDCLSRRLAHYFGEYLAEDCGHCSNCLGESSLLVEATPTIPEKEELLRALEHYLKIIGEYDSLRNRGRFLCGISFPLVRKLKLRKVPGFGSFQNISLGTALKVLSKDISPSPNTPKH